MTDLHHGEAGRVVILCGDAASIPLPDASVDLIVSSPPYWSLRSYSDGGEHYAGQIGSEATPREYVAALLDCTREWMRVLKPEGSLFVNLGDKYSTGNSGQSGLAEWSAQYAAGGAHTQERAKRRSRGVPGMAPKSLLGLPWRYALGCIDDLGLILRAEIVWAKPNCLSGGTAVYAKVKGRPTTVKVHDLCRHYAPEDVQLWNGQRWTQVLWWQPTGRHPDAAESMKAIRAARRRGDEPVVAGDIEIELRSGERIGCTREHRWPTQRGLVNAAELAVGDVIETCPMPEGEATPAALDDDMIGWFVGLYIAEGSHGSDRTIQIAGHVKEAERYKRLRELAEAFHGTCTAYATGGKSATINLTGRFLDAIIDTYVGGRTSKDKHLRPACWQRSNRFLRAVLDGYLSGDGCWREDSRQWVLAFTDNDALAADLRALGSRLGLSVRLTRCTHTGFGKEWPGWRGTIAPAGQRRRPDSEIVAVRQSRARQFWDIGVEDEPHLFALASGVLTHNSLPESVTDRVRRSHEQVFHFTRQPRYYSAVDEIREPHQPQSVARSKRNRFAPDLSQPAWSTPNTIDPALACNPLGKLPGSVWSIPSQPLKVPPELGIDHFAAFPMELPRRIILGWSPSGVCVACGQGRRPVAEVQAQPGLTGEPVETRRREPGEAETRQIAAFIKAHREAAGLSLREVDEACGTNTAASWWEGRARGIRLPAPPLWRRLKAVLSLPDTWDHLMLDTYMRPSGTMQSGPAMLSGRHQTTGHVRLRGVTAITGYACACPDATAPTRPSVVLDPFGGTGTTALVASVLGRTGVSVDRSADYCRLARWRTADPGQRAKAAGKPKPKAKPGPYPGDPLFGTPSPTTS